MKKVTKKALTIIVAMVMVLSSLLGVGDAKAEGITGDKEIRYHSNGVPFKDGSTLITQIIDPTYGYEYPQFDTLNKNSVVQFGPAPGYQLESDGTPLVGMQFIGWATSPDSKEDVTQKVYADKITESTDFYAIWLYTYKTQFDGNGGNWYYKPSPAEVGLDAGPVLIGLRFEGSEQVAFKDEMNNKNNPSVNRGVFKLKAPNSFAKFKGWYTEKEKVSAPHDFSKPITEPFCIYAHWTTQLRIDVLNDEDRNTTDYTVKVTDTKNQKEVKGGFTGQATGNGNDQWQSESRDFYMGDKLTIEFTKLPEGKKVEIISIPFLDWIALVEPVKGKANTFTVSMNKMPHLDNQEAYYARFRLVDDETPQEPEKPVKPVVTPTEKENIGGGDRTETAELVSKKYFASADNVVVARRDDFPDALTASVLAKALDAPILLTHTDHLDVKTASEIKRLGAKKAYIIGLDGAISTATEKAIAAITGQVERIGGHDRYDTSAKIAKKVVEIAGNKKTAVVATGENFADALSVSPYAAKMAYPILLVKHNQVPEVIAKTVKELGTDYVYIAGGDQAVSTTLEKALPTLLTRIAGSDRFETSRKLAEKFFERAHTAFLATGMDFADALVVGPVAAKEDAPILLTRADLLPEVVKSHIAMANYKKIMVIGGEAAIHKTVWDSIK